MGRATRQSGLGPIQQGGDLHVDLDLDTVTNGSPNGRGLASQETRDLHVDKDLSLEDSRLFPLTCANLERAKRVALEGWRERAKERGRDPLPVDLSGACKFASLFPQSLFGGELKGNYDHQFLFLNGEVVDLTEGSEELNRLKAEGKNPYRHDRGFWGNPEHRASLDSCKKRVAKWVDNFKSSCLDG